MHVPRPGALLFARLLAPGRYLADRFTARAG